MMMMMIIIRIMITTILIIIITRARLRPAGRSRAVRGLVAPASQSSQKLCSVLRRRHVSGVRGLQRGWQCALQRLWLRCGAERGASSSSQHTVLSSSCADAATAQAAEELSAGGIQLAPRQMTMPSNSPTVFRLSAAVRRLQRDISRRGVGSSHLRVAVVGPKRVAAPSNFSNVSRSGAMWSSAVGCSGAPRANAPPDGLNAFLGHVALASCKQYRAALHDIPLSVGSAVACTVSDRIARGSLQVGCTAGDHNACSIRRLCTLV